MKIPLKGSVYRVHNHCGLLLAFDRKYDCLWEGERGYFVQSYRQEERDSRLKTRWQLLEEITAIKRKR